jgi:hypothetical protein
MRNKKIFYSVGNEDVTFRNDLLEFDKLFKHDSLKTLNMSINIILRRPHDRTIPAYYDALRFVFKNWKYNKTK